MKQHYRRPNARAKIMDDTALNADEAPPDRIQCKRVVLDKKFRHSVADTVSGARNEFDRAFGASVMNTQSLTSFRLAMLGGCRRESASSKRREGKRDPPRPAKRQAKQNPFDYLWLFTSRSK